MRHFFEILNVKSVSLNFDDSPFVLIYVAIVGSTEYCDNTGQLLRFLPVMYFIALALYLMCSYYKGEVVVIEEFLGWTEAILNGALSFGVFHEVKLVCNVIFYGV